MITRRECPAWFFPILSPMIQTIRDSFLSAIYPQKCSLCDGLVSRAADGCVCSECWEKTRLFTGLETLCLKCGALLSDAEPLFDTYCHTCDDAAFDSAMALGPYRDGIMASVIFLKRTPTLAERLVIDAGRLLADKFAEKEVLLMPVPLSARRRLERGFNQAEVIADRLSKKLGIKVDKHSLIRTRHTSSHRAAMDRKARESSVKNAFELKRKNFVKSKNVLLIDDVMTSGATVSACAKILKKGGAAEVNVLTLGRAVLTT